MNENPIRTFGRFIGLGVICVALSGCAWSVGGKKGGTTMIEPTKGQQLIDLQKARDSGAINDEEYEKMKNRVVGE